MTTFKIAFDDGEAETYRSTMSLNAADSRTGYGCERLLEEGRGAEMERQTGDEGEVEENGEEGEGEDAEEEHPNLRRSWTWTEVRR